MVKIYITTNIAFYTLVGKLKELPRKGWVDRGIPNPETVAEHMYRSQYIAHTLNMCSSTKLYLYDDGSRPP